MVPQSFMLPVIVCLRMNIILPGSVRSIFRMTRQRRNWPHSGAQRFRPKRQPPIPSISPTVATTMIPQEHAVWAAELTALGRNPAMPWKMQSSLIEIDSEHDFISDKGDEVWNILHSRRIQNVILVGVHTNMCVLGRPFGLRQMVRSGKNVVLMRDMTDCMYNPESWPYVDHFTGNDLIVSHVERFVCPTITSDQILGGAAIPLEI